MTANFPTELVLQVIGHLDEEHDKTTLAKCSLLGRFFQKDAQRHLFSHVGFRYAVTNDSTLQDYSKSATQFLRTLVESPELATYVRSFSLCLVDRPARLFTTGTAPIPTQASTLYDILPLLKSLSELAIIGINDIFQEAPWTFDSLPTPLTEAIERMLQTNIVSLSITGALLFPHTILSHASNLENLIVSTNSFRPRPDDASEEVQRETPIYLKSLAIHTNPHEPKSLLSDLIGFLTQRGCPVSLSQLTSLDIGRCKNALPFNLVTLLSICPGRLETLVLPIPSAAFGPYRVSAVPDDWASFSRILDLQRFTNLSSLVFSGHLISRGQVFYTSLFWLGKVIQTINSTNPALRMHVTFYLAHIPLTYEPLDWENLVNPLFWKIGKVENMAVEVLFYDKAMDSHPKEITTQWMRSNLKDSAVLERLGRSFTLRSMSKSIGVN